MKPLIAHSEAEWLAFRHHDVTASQIGALAGVHPYCSLFELWMRKTGKLPAEEPTPGMERGHELEPLALRRIGQAYPKAEVTANIDFADGVCYWRDARRRIGATPDCLVKHPERGLGVVQIKSIEPSIFRREWIEDGDTAVPVWVALQALTEAKLTGAKWAQVAALRVGHRIEMDLIDVPLHDGVWSRFHDLVGDFWRMVASGILPEPDFGRDGKLIAMLQPQDHGQTIDLSADNELVNSVHERMALRDRLVEIERRMEHLDSEIRWKAGDAETVLAGDWRIVLKTESVKEYVVKARTRRPLRIYRSRTIKTKNV
jgi:predicted phage-related endonuclease